MRILKLTLFALLLLPILAQSQGAVKVGVVDIQRAAIESNDGIAATEQLQVYFDELQAGLVVTDNALTEAATRLETTQRALSAAAITQLQNEITRLQTKLQRDSEDAELNMNARQSELVNPIYEKVQQIVLEYAEEQRFTLILDASAGVIHASAAADITNEIIRRLNDSEAGEAAADPLPPAEQ